MLGQSYKVYLHLEMPETQRNRELGMFMVCADMRDEATELLDHSCRSVMLHYKSSLVRAIRTWLLSPLYVFDLQEEKQRIEVELFPEYSEDQVSGRDKLRINLPYTFVRFSFHQTYNSKLLL